MANKELVYKTFQELLDEVSLDFHTYSNEGMIEPSQLIKTAQKVNYDLGLRIQQTKSDILDIHNGKARLPDDFYTLNYALICSHYKRIQPKLQGRHTEDVLITETTDTCNKCHKIISCEDVDITTLCNCEKVYTNDCGDSYQVIHKLGFDTWLYDEFEQLTFKPGRLIDKNSFNLQCKSRHNAEIKNGFIYTNLIHGKLHINYEGNMEDEEGNLLVLDHSMINEYYEYSLKQRILENLYINGEDVVQKLQLIEQRLRAARNYALSIVNTPDFSELKAIWEMNRKAQHSKYYSMFVK